MVGSFEEVVLQQTCRKKTFISSWWKSSWQISNKPTQTGIDFGYARSSCPFSWDLSAAAFSQERVVNETSFLNFFAKCGKEWQQFQ